MRARILFVEDYDPLREMLFSATSEIYEVEAVSSAEEAIEKIGSRQYDIAVVDVVLPGMSGNDLIPHLMRVCPNIIVIVMSGNATVATAVEAMKRGAFDFLTKPFKVEDLLSLLKVAVSRIPVGVPWGESDLTHPDRIIGASEKMQQVMSQATTIAPFNTTVLITGDTGTGKELLARFIHEQSPRSRKPFIALNCAAIPEQLLEDELFGHVKGAFTGAHSNREGRFEQANNGTLFLDEIGDMGSQLQAKLLRVLQERKFEKLGSPRTITADVRIIAATSADLDRKIMEGTFRADLYYRLNVVRLQLPALNQRTEDIPHLAEYLLGRFCVSAGLPRKQIDGNAMSALVGYRWPGNIRQLQNAMERAAALTGASTVIRLEDLPEEVRGGAALGISPVLASKATIPIDDTVLDDGIAFDTVVTEVERELLFKSLQKTGGNKMQAAKLLNMKRTTFVEKLKRLGITDFGDPTDCAMGE